MTNFLTIAGGILAAGLLVKFAAWNLARFGWEIAILGVLAAVAAGIAGAVCVLPDDVINEYVVFEED